MGSLLAFQTSSKSSFKIQAFVGIYGVYDLTTQVTEREGMMFQRLMGKPLQELPEEYKIASSATYKEGRASRPTFVTDLLLIWGDADKVASPAQSENFSKRLNDAGLHVETVILPGKGHFWFNLTPGLKGGNHNDFKKAGNWINSALHAYDGWLF